MRNVRVGMLAAAVTLATFGMAGTAAAQSPPTGISVVDGKTAPVFDYDQAIRERVYIPNGQDADLDGVEDRTAIEIMRPKESGPDLKVPAIVAPSPYYTADCGQFVGECIGDLDADGVNDRWPLWYDNFFVPRGYAVILAEMDGTANSTGCATNGGPRTCSRSRSSSTGSTAACRATRPSPRRPTRSSPTGTPARPR